MLATFSALQVASLLVMPMAEAKNRYRVERIYRLALRPAETCAQAWLRHHPRGRVAPPEHALGPDGNNRDGTAPPPFPVNSFVAVEGRRCIVTLFCIAART
jgi:hypothetical protein